MVDRIDDDHAESGKKLSAEDVKAIVLSELVAKKRVARNATIASEYPIRGQRVRADLALLGRSLIGVEIKSASDNLRRLDKQMQGYKLFFDDVILVLASRHVKNFDVKNYEWLEVWELRDCGKIHVIQRRTKRFKSETPDYKCFLTMKEIKRFFAEGNVDSRRALLAAFSMKFHCTSDAFWGSVVGNDIKRKNIELLSRFRSKRELLSQARRIKSKEWDNWILDLKKMNNQSTQISSVSYKPCPSP